VVDKVGDRFPRNIIALFDAGIERIKQQPKHEADIALLAIAATAEQIQGISLIVLEEWMRDALSRLPHLASAPPRSLEDILRCANGYIVEVNYDADDRHVSAYCTPFAQYVKENYNETLFWYRSQLNIRRASRSMTGMCPTQPKLTSPPMVASPPSMDNDFETTRAEMKGRLLGSSPDYFGRSFKPGEHQIPPKQRPSLPTLPTSMDSELGIKKLKPSARSYTMLPTSKRSLRDDIVSIFEDDSSNTHDKPRLSRSIHKPTSRICSFCEVHIFGSSKLSGTYHRPYSSLNLFMARKCVFCTTLYKEFLDMPKADREKLQDVDSPHYHWSIRTTAKSRESKNSIVLTFQPMQRGTNPNAEPSPQQSPLDVQDSSDSRAQTLPQMRRFHLLSEDDLGALPTQDDVGSTTDPSSKAVGKQVNKWIHDCNQNHAKCIKAAKTTWVPTRLLDLQFGDLSSVRLVKTAEEGIQGPYVTLSHCWGPRTDENTFLVTLGETEKVYMTKGVKVSALSTNFQQAISVARLIGIRYIWIDSLCIIQGAASDFASEGMLMHKVYRYSYCNFAAADSVDSRGGLFRTRNPSDVLPGRYEGDGSSAVFGATKWRVVPEDLWEKELLDTSIYTRGWVFQGMNTLSLFCCADDD